MAVLLVRKSSLNVLPNRVTVKCPRCDQTYQMTCSDDEWNRVKDWITLAERALRVDHKSRHEAEAPALVWNPVLGK
jgi:hypothetical protein